MPEAERKYPYVERAPTGRARCMVCKNAIEKGALRVAFERSVMVEGSARRSAGYLHPGCTPGYPDAQELGAMATREAMLANSAERAAAELALVEMSGSAPASTESAGSAPAATESARSAPAASKRSRKKKDREVQTLLESFNLQSLRKLLKAQPEKLADLNEARALHLALAPGGKPRLAFARELIERGAALDTLREHEEYLIVYSPISSLLELDIPEDNKLELLRLMLERGADPNFAAPTAASALVRCHQLALLELLTTSPRITQTTLGTYLTIGIEEAWSRTNSIGGGAAMHDWLAPLVDYLVEQVEDTSRSCHTRTSPPYGERVLSPLHAAALVADPEFVGLIRERARAPSVGLDADLDFAVEAAQIATKGGFVPTVRLRKGMTARDSASAVVQFLEQKQKQFEKKESEKAQAGRAAVIARLRAVEQLLASAGVTSAVRMVSPAFEGPLRKVVADLAGFANIDRVELEKRLAVVRANGDKPENEFQFLIDALSVVRPFLPTDARDRAAAQTTLLFSKILLEEDPFADSMVEYGDSGSPVTSYYPKEAHRALIFGEVLGGTDGNVFVLWPKKHGGARVCHVHMSGFWIHAETIQDFAKSQVAALMS